MSFFYFHLTAQAEREGYDDQTWSDVGNEFSIDEKGSSSSSSSSSSQKRSFSDINDSEGLLSMGAFVEFGLQNINLR